MNFFILFIVWKSYFVNSIHKYVRTKVLFYIFHYIQHVSSVYIFTKPDEMHSVVIFDWFLCSIHCRSITWYYTVSPGNTRGWLLNVPSKIFPLLTRTPEHEIISQMTRHFLFFYFQIGERQWAHDNTFCSCGSREVRLYRQNII